MGHSPPVNLDRLPARRRSLLAALLLFAAVDARAEKKPNEVRLAILQTSDLHGHLLPWDYQKAKEADWGLARVATRVREARRTERNLLLLDAGDTIQGSPIQFLHSRNKDAGKDAMAATMSAIGYDAMAVGNHEFNFGLDVLRKAERESTFPWLSANTRRLDGSAAFAETLVKTYDGVRVGILGMTTPNIPGWEPEANRPGLKWEDPVDTAKRLVPILRGKERCDFVVVVIHSGAEIDLETGEANGTAHENRVADIAKSVPGVDLLLTGHTHRKIPLTKIHGVPMIQPGRWGEAVARVDVRFVRKGGRWSVASLDGALLPSDASVAPDEEIARLAAPYHDAALRYLDETVANAEEAFPAGRARLEDTPLLDLVNDAQLEATGADLSAASLLPGGSFSGLPKGPVKVRDLFALYPYENQLVVVEVTGDALRRYLERAAEFYGDAAWAGGRLVLTPKKGMVGYNFDALAGATYRLDPTAPVGARVKELRIGGRAVAPTDRFTLAVNSYRAQGGGGYEALKGSKVVKLVATEIRDLLIDRVRKLGTLTPKTDRNWVVAPDAVWAEPPARLPAQ